MGLRGHDCELSPRLFVSDSYGSSDGIIVCRDVLQIVLLSNWLGLKWIGGTSIQCSVSHLQAILVSEELILVIEIQSPEIDSDVYALLALWKLIHLHIPLNHSLAFKETSNYGC